MRGTAPGPRSTAGAGSHSSDTPHSGSGSRAVKDRVDVVEDVFGSQADWYLVLDCLQRQFGASKFRKLCASGRRGSSLRIDQSQRKDVSALCS